MHQFLKPRIRAQRIEDRVNLQLRHLVVTRFVGLIQFFDGHVVFSDAGERFGGVVMSLSMLAYAELNTLLPIALYAAARGGIT